jgi:membrane associated rhomboid family serine protease
VINTLLILANLAAFVYELSMPNAAALEIFIQRWALIPSGLLASPIPQGLTIFTSMFLHGGWMHVVGNMLYLWVFGDNVEDRVGHFRYLLFYLIVGAAAALTQVYFHPASRIPMIGASGAVAGILGAYFVLYPSARVLAAVPIWIFIRFIELPAILFLGFWFVIQALQGVGSITHAPVQGDVGGVAWWAHAGGFVAGMFLIFFFRKKKRSYL